MIQTLKEDIAEEKIKELLKALEQLGFEPEETTILLQETIKEMKS